MKIGRLSEAARDALCLRFPSCKLLDVAKHHGQTILMVSQSIMIPVDLPLSPFHRFESEEIWTWFGGYGQLPAAMSSKKQQSPPSILQQYDAVLENFFELSGQVMFLLNWHALKGSPPTPENDHQVWEHNEKQQLGNNEFYLLLTVRVWFPRPGGHRNKELISYLETRLPHTVPWHTVPWLFVWYSLLLWPEHFFRIYVLGASDVGSPTKPLMTIDTHFVPSLLGRKHRFGLLCLKWFEDVLN